ncbi:hypothetical protein BV22DRAFT_1126882 [Leucogyrophana mollusca]|uniref:Uncharacterized protein n=1 Tax=Leucogyrophana mollusca TaxID=85980 RepID=A0ACB8BQD5_9AGAM|nr:hypothetical protein BV22DRAFT_1126882 [Leucogyrophana mollusca]
MSLADVERPVSSISDRRRRRDSPEIIDVDALDADDIVPRPPTQRRRLADGRPMATERDIIYLSDNEDDPDIQFLGSSQGTPQRVHTFARRERIFSPPPPPQMEAIPPVPEVPRRFIRMRRHPPPFPTAAGVVLPNDQPFPFEANIRRHHPAPSFPIPPPAAPSHHVPVMGFGGAIIAFARDIMGGGENANGNDRGNGHPRRRMMNFEPGIFGHWNALNVFGERDDQYLDEDAFPFLDAGADQDNPFAYVARGRLNGHRDLSRGVEPDYKPEYTHPDRPAPGISFDFAPSSSPSSPASPSSSNDKLPSTGNATSSTVQSNDACTTFACARCHSPLILGGVDVAEGRNRRKLWGLRCGHLLDGKCIEELMKPALIPECAFEESKADEKGKGKLNDGLSTPSSERPSVSIKGKGKEVWAPEHGNPGLQAFPLNSDTEYNNPIRSRLRPRHPPASPVTRAERLPAPPSSRRRGEAPDRTTLSSSRSRAKGKGKVKGPVVEAEHEWKCPVNGCGQVHLSLLVGGQWTMDGKKGAVAVFV